MHLSEARVNIYVCLEAVSPGLYAVYFDKLSFENLCGYIALFLRFLRCYVVKNIKYR